MKRFRGRPADLRSSVHDQLVLSPFSVSFSKLLKQIDNVIVGCIEHKLDAYATWGKLSACQVGQAFSLPSGVCFQLAICDLNRVVTMYLDNAGDQAKLASCLYFNRMEPCSKHLNLASTETVAFGLGFKQQISFAD